MCKHQRKYLYLTLLLVVSFFIHFLKSSYNLKNSLPWHYFNISSRSWTAVGFCAALSVTFIIFRPAGIWEEFGKNYHTEVMIFQSWTFLIWTIKCHKGHAFQRPAGNRDRPAKSRQFCQKSRFLAGQSQTGGLDFSGPVSIFSRSITISSRSENFYPNLCLQISEIGKD